MKTLTIAVATYQRREAALRLARSLAADVRAAPELAAGVRLLVTVDGSDDGSAEALRAVADSGELGVPLDVQWHPNAGLAATRDGQLRDARSELVWFLDDDVVPAPGTFARHRTAHDQVERVLVGPCLLPPDASTIPALRDHYDRLWATLADSGRIDRFDRFSAANTSAPVALLLDQGGFCTGFEDYGREDFELGHRLLRSGVRLDFDPAASAVHHQHRGLAEFLGNARSEGANSVRMVSMHPETADVLFASSPRGRAHAALRRLRLAAPLLVGLSRLTALAAARTAGSRQHRLMAVAYDTSFYAGAIGVPGGRLLVRRALSAS